MIHANPGGHHGVLPTPKKVGEGGKAGTRGYTLGLRKTRATLATIVVNSSGSTGLGMCML